MDRLACVDVPALPLQLLLQQQPEWRHCPVAVVDEDKPQGIILWVNRLAREAGIRPGLRYGPALSMAGALRAAVVEDAAIEAGLNALIKRLYDFSPEVEPSAREPGVFWLDAGGLEHLYASPDVWAQAVRADLAGADYIAGVVVGFRRFGTYAAARALRGTRHHVFDTPELEEAAIQKVSLGMVGLTPGVRDALEKLGVRTLGEFLKLPAHGIARRFGAEAHQLHRFAAGDLDLPLSPVRLGVPFEEQLAFDYRESNAERLVFIVKPLVDRLLGALGQAGQALVELQLRLLLEDAPERLERVRTAEPTLQSVLVMELVKLRLSATPFTAPVVGLVLTASAVPATAEQLRIFAEAPHRDLRAAARAFARLRAAFGSEDVVVKAVMRDRHSPEGCFGWEPIGALPPAHPAPQPEGTLVRRIFSQPEPLPHHPQRGPDGWLLRGPAHGPVETLNGPYRLQGGWWRSEVQRDYYYAQMHKGELYWVYYDRERRRWFLHGEIS